MSMQNLMVRVPYSIEVLSPIHIGTGQTIHNKGFVVTAGQVLIADEERLLNRVSQSVRLQADFETFCLGEKNLQQFLSGNGIAPVEIILYTAKKLGQRVDSRRIWLFIKSPESPPRPYIPGSTLKGALRSALLRAHLLADVQARDKAKQKVESKFGGKAKEADNELEKWFFGKDQHHEWVRLLEFTDTTPISTDSLGVADVRVFSASNSKGQSRSGSRGELREKAGYSGQVFVLSPEVLLTGTKLRGHFIVNAYLTASPAKEELQFKKGELRFKFGIQEIAECFNRVAEDQIAQEIAFYTAYQRDDLVGWYQSLDKRRKDLRADRLECLVRLGWGTGYDNKTVSDVFDDQTFRKIREKYDLAVGSPGRVPLSKGGTLLPKDQSPKSRKLAVMVENGKERVEPLGWAILRIEG